MEQIFKTFVKQYTDASETNISKSKQIRSLRNPVIFVFIGDKVIEASKKIYTQINSEWENSDGVLFLNVFSTENLVCENMFNFNADCEFSDIKTARQTISAAFYNSEDKLIQLNNLLIKMKNKLREYGKLFTYFKKINIAVITRADDPMNVLVKEITLLLKVKLSQMFNINTADLYTLLVEKNEEEDEFYSGALSVSFFKEIEYYQSKRFCFDKKIEVFDEKRKLSVKWNKPLFGLVYVLSDTNLNGIIKPNSLEENYNIICYINLIKNKELTIETNFDIKNNVYDDIRFKRNISDEADEISFASAGLAVIKKPYEAAAMTVLSCMFDDLIGVMNKNKYDNVQEILTMLDIDEKSLYEKVESLVPVDKTIEDMYEIKIQNNKDLKGLSLRGAEQVLYGQECENFFAVNFGTPLAMKVKNIDIEKTTLQNLNKMLFDPEMGLYCCYVCTGERFAKEVINEIFNKYDKAIKKQQAQVDELYESYLRDSLTLTELLIKNRYIENIKQQLFEEIYQRKMVILKLTYRKKLLEMYALVLIKHNEDFSKNINGLESLKGEIKEYTEKLINKENNYTGQNISEYYTAVASKKIAALKEKFGEKFYFKEGFLGNPAKLMENGIEPLIETLQQICLKYVLSEEEFKMTFEDELKERKNLKGFTKENIYKDLCTLLDENAIPKSLIYEYNVKMYEEKYFFGDYSSDFIKYAYSFDKEWRNYSIGYIHEKTAAGIEKLSLFGGFKLNDLVYYKNSLKYYEALEQEIE